MYRPPSRRGEKKVHLRLAREDILQAPEVRL